MTLDSLLKTARLSFRNPRQGLRVVLTWQLSLSESGLALALMGVLSAGLISLVIGPLPAGVDPITAMMLTNPLFLAMVQLAGLGMMTVAMHLLGQVTKGRGTFPEAVAMMAWLEALWIAISVVQSLALILLPPLGLILVPVGMVLSLWLLTSFVAELHGFASLFLTLLGVVAAFLATVIAMTVLFFLLFALGVLHV